MKKILSKVVVFSVLTMVLFQGTFFIGAKKAGAIVITHNPGDVLINEFYTNDAACPAGNQWFELINTTASDISLTGWTLTETSGMQSTSLDGKTIPAHGLVTFTTVCYWASTAGDVLVLKEGSTQIHAVSYGTSPSPGAPNHVNAPGMNQSAILSAGTWSVTATPSRGWFNNATSSIPDCNMSALTNPPTLNALSDCLGVLMGVTTNIGELSDPSNTPNDGVNNLFFEAYDGSAPIGKIEYNASLNLTDADTVSLLTSLGDKMSMTDGAVALDASTSEMMRTSGAEITIYGIDSLGYSDAPNIIVKDDTGAVISPDDPSYPTLTDVTYDSGDLTFSTDHFTGFEVGPTLSMVTPVPEFTNDNTPSITFTSDVAAGGMMNPYPGSSASISGGCSSIQLSMAGVSVGENTRTLGGPGGLADDTYSGCVLTVTDAAGHSSTLDIPTFTVDTSVPSVEITSPSEGARVGNNTKINFNITGDYNTVICDIPADQPDESCESGVTKISDIDIFSDISEGESFTLRVRVFDAAGNEGSATVLDLVKDTNPPYLSSVAFGDGSTADIGTEGFLGFSEDLTEAARTAIQNALQDATTTTLAFDWNPDSPPIDYNVNLRVTTNGGTDDIAFTKSVWVLLKDEAGNADWSRLVDTSTNPTTQIQNGDGPFSVTADNQEYIVQPSTTTTTLNVTFGSDNSTLNLGAFTSGGVASSLPEINISKTTNDAGDKFDVNIPSGTNITADDPSWTGVLNVPQVTTITTPGTFDSAIEIGFPDIELTFNKAVKLTFEGKAGKKIGYKRGDGDFHEITMLCSDMHGYGLAVDKQAFMNDHLGAGSACKIDSDADLVVWTKHFTAFAIYTSTNTGGGGSYNGGSNDITAPTNTSISIDAGAVSTTSTSATLTLGATDNYAVTQMAISNIVDFANINWETYATSKNWTLTDGNGTKTVYAKFRDAAGNVSSVASDTITLTGQATDQVIITPPAEGGQFRTQELAVLSNEEIARRVPLMQGTYDWQLIYQSPYPAALAPNAETEVWIEVKNIGTATWFNNGDNVVRLGSGSSYGNAGQQRDYASEFANENWYSANRPTNIMHPEVDPGWHTRFQFIIKAPSTPGVYKAYFTPVVDGLQWMKDIGLYWQITVQ